MTVLDDQHLVDWDTGRAPRRPMVRAVGPRRPVPTRPGSTPLRYRGSGVAMSRAPHARRGVSTSVTVALAGMAALITLWLGSLANFSAERSAAPAAIPDQLAVVRVQAGETLAQLARRIAPDVPSGRVVERIRDLNKLESAAVDAGQTLIAPVG